MPLTEIVLGHVPARGCIDQRVEAKSLRRGLREIRNQNARKAALYEGVPVKHVDPSLSGMGMPSVAAKAARHHNGDMSNEIPSIVDAALNLPDPERASLAYRLLQSLKPPKVLSDANSQFESEIDRRVEDYEAGRTTASDWDEVASRLQAKLKKRETS